MYGITMRKVTDPGKNTIDIYEKQMEYFTKILNCTFKNVSYERTAGLHMHAFVEIPRDVSLLRFRVRGWSIKLEEIYDAMGWLEYIMKDQPFEQQDLTETPKDEVFIPPKKRLF